MNIRDLSLTDLTKLRREVLAAIKALRPRAAKPKPSKARSQEERERARAWELMLQEAERCEACGSYKGESPRWWRAFNPLDRAHIIGGNGYRIEDRRLCIILCRACHTQQTSGRVVGCPLEPLTLGNLHWLKMQHADYDPVFIRACNGDRPLPPPVALPEGYRR